LYIIIKATLFPSFCTVIIRGTLCIMQVKARYTRTYALSREIQQEHSIYYCCISAFVLCAFAKLWKATISFVISVRLSAWNNSAPARWILMSSDIWVFFLNSVEKIQVSLISEKKNGYFTWRAIYIFDHVSKSFSKSVPFIR
jgi:hypothetical protein